MTRRVDRVHEARIRDADKAGATPALPHSLFNERVWRTAATEAERLREALGLPASLEITYGERRDATDDATSDGPTPGDRA